MLYRLLLNEVEKRSVPAEDAAAIGRPTERWCLGAAFTWECTPLMTRLEGKGDGRGTPFRASSSFFVAKKRKGGLSLYL